MTNPSETKLVERLREAQWDEAKHRPAFNRAIADGAPVEVLEQVEEVAKLCAEAATALASLADELRLARERVAELEKSVLGKCEECGQTIITPLHHLPSVEKDAARYRWLRDRPSLIGWDWWVVKVPQDTNICPEFLDEAIDEALKETR